MKKFFSLSMLAIAIFGSASLYSLASAQDLLTYNLRIGMKGDAQVTTMQNLLISQNYLAAGNNTGRFGPLTFQAVRTYQGANGISKTGFVGPATRASMNAAITSGAGANLAYVPGCTSFTGFSQTTGASCANTSSLDVNVTPVQISNVASNSAIISSSFTAPSSAYYTVRFEYATDPNAFILGTQSRIGQIILSGKSGSFSASMTNLLTSQKYYVRAVVEGGPHGTVISNTASFTSGVPVGTGIVDGNNTAVYQNQATALSGQPYVGTNAASGVIETGATISGVYDGRGSATTVYFQYWTGSGTIGSTPQAVGGSATGVASLALTGLIPGTTYSYRIVASNAYGTVYGATINFTTIEIQNSNGWYINYNNNGSNGSVNMCAGALPNITASMDSSSASASIAHNQVAAPLFTARISTDCDASLKSLTFTSAPSTLFGTFTNFKVYLNGSTSPLAGTFSGPIFTLTTPVVLNAGTYAKVALKATIGPSGTGTVRFGLSNIVAQSSGGVTNQYPVSVLGNILAYTFVINTIDPIIPTVVVPVGGTTGGSQGTSGGVQ